MNAEKVQQAMRDLKALTASPYIDHTTVRRAISLLEEAIKPESTCKHCTSFDHCREEFGIKETSQECRMAKYYNLRRELEEHINGGGLHADIESRLSVLEDVDATTTGAFAVIEQRLFTLESNQKLHDKVLQELSAKAYNEHTITPTGRVKCPGCNGLGFHVVPVGMDMKGTTVCVTPCDRCSGVGDMSTTTP